MHPVYLKVLYFLYLSFAVLVTPSRRMNSPSSRSRGELLGIWALDDGSCRRKMGEKCGWITATHSLDLSAVKSGWKLGGI